MVEIVSQSTTPNKSYVLKLFSSRINRSGFFWGITFTSIASELIFGFISIILEFFTKTSMGFLLSLPIYIVFFFFLLSFMSRRLHDLNKNVYLISIVIPSIIIFILQLWLEIPGNYNTTYAVFVNSVTKNNVYIIYNFLSNIFFLYLLIWPGVEVPNKYGPPSRRWTIKEMFALTEQNSTKSVVPENNRGFIKLLLKILFGLILFLVLFIAGIFAFGFIEKSFYH